MRLSKQFLFLWKFIYFFSNIFRLEYLTLLGNNKNNIPISKSQNIFLTFFFNGKQLFIESNQNETFQAIISKLEKKYNWVKGTNKKAYLYNNQVIDIQYTLKQLNIPDNSNIYII